MADRLKIIFMGTPDFAVPALERLLDSPHEVLCVFTQPPRPKGRGQKVQPSPVHALAAARGIAVYTPASLKKDAAARALIAALAPDVAVVAAYGLILPPDVLAAPRFGCLNIHASLLPRWRGASPIQHAIWQGDARTGITIMQMDEGLDTGAMIERRAVPIRPQTTAQSLHDELAALGGALAAEVLARLAREGILAATPQDAAAAIYAPLLKKEDGAVDWTQPAGAIDRQIRALNPWPGVWTVTDDGRRLKIIAAEPVSEIFSAPPGTLIDNAGHVACGGDSGLRLKMIQPDNAKPMDIIAALNGHYVKIDGIFG